MRAAALECAGDSIVNQGIDSGRRDIGVASQVVGGVEQWMRGAAFMSSPEKKMCEWSESTGGDVRMTPAIVRRVE
jgi:hypothetical protein